MRIKNLLSAFAAALLLGASSLVQAAPFMATFELLPSGGAIEGAAGSLVGWGYRIENQDATNWFVTSGISASSFALGTPDASYFDFPIIAPGDVASQSFDATAFTGLFGVSLLPGALPGQSEAGVFTLTGEWWSGDPFGSGSFLRDADPSTAGFRLVIAADSTAVPAPGTFWLLVLGLPLLALRFKRA